jgi:hypothetical protein
MDSTCQTELRLKGMVGDQGKYEVREEGGRRRCFLLDSIGFWIL